METLSKHNTNDKENSAFQKAWKKRFESFASSLNDDAGIAGWSKTGLDTRVRYFFSEWTAEYSGENWLDIGCGAGTYSRELSRQGKKVTGIDYSYQTLVKARERTDTRLNIQWLLGDATRIPIADKQMDGVVSLGVVQALSESARLVNELVRVTRSGGEIWIDGLNFYCLPHLLEMVKRRVRGQEDHLRYESAVRLEKLLLDAGVSSTKIIWMPIVPGRWYNFQNSVHKARSLFQLPVISHLLCHSFLIRAEK
jgi:ubiquinone/menaquinone biosynthesis C-methylase UbiE